MLKTAIYGLLRVTFDLLHVQLWWWGVVGLSLGLRHRAFRRRLRRSANRHEAAARLFLDREHRNHRRRHRACHPVQGVRQGPARGDRAHGGALSLAQPRLLQEPPVPCHRIGTALRHTSAASASWAASSTACPGSPGSRWSARWPSPDCRRSMASFPSGCCCRRSCSRQRCRSRSSTCWSRSRLRR